MSVTWIQGNPPGTDDAFIDPAIYAQVINVYNNRRAAISLPLFYATFGSSDVLATAWPTAQDVIDFQDDHQPVDGVDQSGHPRAMIGGLLQELWDGLPSLLEINEITGINYAAIRITGDPLIGYGTRLRFTDTPQPTLTLPSGPVHSTGAPEPDELYDPRHWRAALGEIYDFLDALQTCEVWMPTYESIAYPAATHLDNPGGNAFFKIGTSEKWDIYGNPYDHVWHKSGGSMKWTFAQGWPDGITPTSLGIVYYYKPTGYPGQFPRTATDLIVQFQHACVDYGLDGNPIGNPSWSIPSWGTFDIDLTVNGTDCGTPPPPISAEDGSGASPGNNTIELYNSASVSMTATQVAALSASDDLDVELTLTVSQAPADHQFDESRTNSGVYSYDHYIEMHTRLEVSGAGDLPELTMAYTYPYQDSEV